MAKAAYAKNFRSVRDFCVLIKKGCDVVPYPFLFIYCCCFYSSTIGYSSMNSP